MAGHARESARNAVMLNIRRLMMPSGLDGRGYMLLAAMLMLTICLLRPQAVLPARVADWFIVLDITQSMNVRDYKVQGKQTSRLESAKLGIREGIRSLPCGSRVALGLFTERATLSITRPLEVCRHYSALEQIVSSMDWRNAWAADSFITHGLYGAIGQTARLGENVGLLFITDGHQAPPANPRYMPAFDGKPGAVKGVIMGSGKTTMSPIPKLDDRNEISEYWTSEEVMRYGNFGMAETLSVLAMEQGQHDRNAGHGPGNDLLSTAHLSRLEEGNLQRLSGLTGLQYARMDNLHAIGKAMLDRTMGVWRPALTDLRPWLAFPALLLTLLFFLPPAWTGRMMKIFYLLTKRRT